MRRLAGLIGVLATAAPASAALGARPASTSAALGAQPAPLAMTLTGPPPATSITEAQAKQVGTDAYDYGFPLMEFLRVARQNTSVTVPDAFADAPINELGNARGLADFAHQPIVQPNNDTLYTSGHLDLGAGPIVLHVPAIPDRRYYSFELMDPYTNVFAYVGTRTTGDGVGNFVITGPGFKGRLPRGLHRIRSHYRRVWMLGRTLVYGRNDLPNVHKIQNGYRLLPLAKYVKYGLNWRHPRPKHIVKTPTLQFEPSGLAFFDQLGTALAENPPPHRDAATLKELRTVGIGPGLHPSKEHLGAAVLAGLTAAVTDGPDHIQTLRTGVAVKSIRATHGWFVPPADTGSYGIDYGFRAVVAAAGLAANRPAEAMYIIGITDPNGSPLNGANDYVIHFPRGQLPPARYFWSLTMYNQAFFLIANPINRYEIGNRTRGLRRNPDGSLDIYLQHDPPPGHRSNWLPAASGQFEVTLRLYGPRRSALDGTYLYPPITKTTRALARSAGRRSAGPSRSACGPR